MNAGHEHDEIDPSGAANPTEFDFGDLDPSVFDPDILDAPAIDPGVLHPRFEVWVHGVVGMQVLSPTPESAFSITRRMGGIHVSPSGSGTDRRVNLVFPFPWPPVVPVGGLLETRRPSPNLAMVLYRTSRAKIRGIVLLEAVTSFGQVVASASVNWSGNHTAALDNQNVVFLTADPQPRFGLALVTIVEFDT